MTNIEEYLITLILLFSFETIRSAFYIFTIFMEFCYLMIKTEKKLFFMSLK